MFHVQCDGCKSMAFTEDASDFDSAVECGCCTESHHHGENANASGQACRPVTITAVPGSVEMKVAR